MKKKLKLSSILILLLIVVLITIGITTLLYARLKLVSYQEFDMLLKVTDKKNDVGIGIIPGMIYFGRMTYGNSGIQKIEIRHNYYEPLLVQLSASGDLKEWTIVSDNNFILEKNITKIIEVKATVPEGAALGNHTGKLKVYMKRI